MNQKRPIACFAAVVVVGCFAAGSASAQTLPNCATGQAEAYLDVNNVRARILNHGGLFWSGSPNIYEIPKGGGLHTAFAVSLWMGGMVEGSLRTAGSTYGPWEFWPGPHDAAINGEDCEAYDRIYELSAGDFIAYDEGHPPSDDMAEWPWQLGAPVVDGDGDPDNYDLEAGDRPELLGDETLFWIMNDVGNAHEKTGSEPLGIEVHVSAFSTTSNARSHFPNSTYYRYKIINRGNSPIEEAYLGLFNDMEVGYFGDDFVGSDSTLNLGFTYNMDNSDGSRTRPGYGEAPPAVGIQVIGSPVAETDGQDNDGFTDETGEMLGLTAFVYYNNGGGVQGEPKTANDFYNYMQARWKDGQRVTVGGSGRNFSQTPTSFMFPADPPGFWSEFTFCNGGTTACVPSDKWSLLGIGPFNLNPGESTELFFSAITAFGNDNLSSVKRLKVAATWDTTLRPQDVPRGPSQPVPVVGPKLLTPGPNSTNQPAGITFSWQWDQTVNDTDVQISRLADFSGPAIYSTWRESIEREMEPDTEYFWRARGKTLGGYGPWSSSRRFSTGAVKFDIENSITDFVVTQNASGPLIPVEGAGPEWQGFPGTGRATDRQQISGAHWYFATDMSSRCPGGDCGSYQAFLTRNIIERSGFDNLAGFNWEIRFDDEENWALDLWVSGLPERIPFSVWRTNVGPPRDASADVRYIPIWLDDNNNQSFDLNVLDHDASGGSDDPFTEAIYIFSPVDREPGSKGYQDWLTEARDSGSAADEILGEEVMGRIVFFNNDAGDVTDGTLDAIPLDERMPEPGTIFRMETRLPPAPIPTTPGPDEIVGPGPVTFAWWSYREPASKISLATDPGLTNVIWERELTSSTEAVFPDITQGVYYWRVTDWIGQESPVQRFEVQLSVALDESPLPGEFALDAIFPNPFSVSTTIGYTLRDSGQVRIEVFDTLGRKVATVFEGVQGRGKHEVTFSAVNLSSGTYLLRLKTDHRQLSRTMTVIN